VKILAVSDRVEPTLNDREAPSRFPGVDLVVTHAVPRFWDKEKYVDTTSGVWFVCTCL
jgi:hypothetical protein